jgi:hypothetical protein
VLVLLIPTITYAFRLRQVRRPVNPVAGLLLTQVLYLARAAALIEVTRRLLRQRRRSAALAEEGRA